MKRSLLPSLLLICVGLVTFVGCGKPVNRPQADRLANWLRKQSYSSWSTFRSIGKKPERPDSPDGLTLGSPNVFAAVGCNPSDLSEITTLWGDRRAARALAKPLTVSAGEDAENVKPLADFPQQTLRRVRHTAIAVSQAEADGLRVTAVDFAPMEADSNFLVRWYLAENTGTSARRVTLRLNVPVAGDWQQVNAHTLQRGDTFGLVSDADISAREDAVTISLGRLAKGDRASAALFISVAKNTTALGVARARAELARKDPLALLEATRENWEQWCNRTPLVSGDGRTDDLLDSLLCLVRAHVGPEAIHTGSVKYPHNRAWVRDDYWTQRTLLELGHAAEAKVGLDFFHRAWQKGGIASSYQVPDGKPMSWGYPKVELPHYLVLMVRDAEQFGQVDGAPYWDMVKACLDGASVPASGLQPMNGDETWLLASPVRELDDLLDNSWLLIASAEYGSKLALRVGDRDRAASYGAVAYRARLALRSFMPGDGQPEWYAVGRSAVAGQDSPATLDFSLCPEVYARGVMLGVLPSTDGLTTSSLLASWQRLRFDRGIRTHSRSATINGGTPGYVLYAAAQNPVTDALFARDLAKRMLKFASATGCVWEFHDLQDRSWAGEKRRLWDSSVLLLGLTKVLFTPQLADHVTFARREAPVPIQLPADDTPKFDAAALMAKAGPALILEQQSPEHAARISRELLRQRNQLVGVARYMGQLPEANSAIIVSPADPQGTWLRMPLGYFLRAWGGPPQLWVKNMGSVHADTDPVLVDLLSFLTPQRETPLPFPDADFDLASRYGEKATGRVEAVLTFAGATSGQQFDLSGGEAKLQLGDTQVTVSATPSPDHVGTVKLGVTATRPEAAELSLVLPTGWWLLYARDMSGQWDRAADPVREEHLPDGRLRLTYSLRAGRNPFTVAFELTHLRVDQR